MSIYLDILPLKRLTIVRVHFKKSPYIYSGLKIHFFGNLGLCVVLSFQIQMSQIILNYGRIYLTVSLATSDGSKNQHIHWPPLNATKTEDVWWTSTCGLFFHQMLSVKSMTCDVLTREGTSMHESASPANYGPRCLFIVKLLCPCSVHLHSIH